MIFTKVRKNVEPYISIFTPSINKFSHLLFKIISESALIAWSSLVANKLRTMLSLLGIVIGIFVIIIILTAVDSLKKDVNDSLNSLGPNVVYVHKWPWEGGFDYPWWKYFLRPQPSVAEAELIIKRSDLAEAVSYSVDFQRPLKFRDNFVTNAEITGVWLYYDKVQEINISNGRYFTDNELRNGRNVVVIGHNIGQNLFGNQDPIGSNIKIKGENFNVVGVLERAGEGLFGGGADETVYVPFFAAREMVDLNNWNVQQEILVKPKEGVTSTELKDELMGLMRSIRKQKPTEDSNFSLNEASMIKKQTASITGILNIIGLIIGFLALLVGIFGIANIMFVSVKERTNIIGIQKALGAKRIFILVQFLTEAMILTLLGGIFGLILVYLTTLLVQSISSFNMTLSINNVVVAFFISCFAGLFSGIIPAYIASRLDPVEAIRSK
jgi:putative ABC transport system permease protein